MKPISGIFNFQPAYEKKKRKEDSLLDDSDSVRSGQQVGYLDQSSLALCQYSEYLASLSGRGGGQAAHPPLRRQRPAQGNGARWRPAAHAERVCLQLPPPPSPAHAAPARPVSTSARMPPRFWKLFRQHCRYGCGM